MERRKFLVGMGSLAAGSAAAVGTGAFTSLKSGKTTKLNTAEDASALLQIKQTDHPNSQEYTAVDSEGELEVDIPNINQGVTFFDYLFQLQNESSQSQNVWIQEKGGGWNKAAFYVGTGPSDGSKPNFAISFRGGGGNPDRRQPQLGDGVGTAAVNIDTGQSVNVGLAVKSPNDTLNLDNAILNAVADADDAPDALLGTANPSEKLRVKPNKTGYPGGIDF